MYSHHSLHIRQLAFSMPAANVVNHTEAARSVFFTASVMVRLTFVMVECYGNHYSHYGVRCANWAFVRVRIMPIIALPDDISSVGVDDY